MDGIEALDVALLEDAGRLRLIDHWLRVLRWANGWHYDLDLVWILRQIGEMGLPRGAVVLDAGAGLGVLQFILASLGYRVVSLDFTRRNPPRFARGIFDIDFRQETDLGDYDHEYMRTMTYGESRRGLRSWLDPAKWLRLASEPRRLSYLLSSRVRKRINPAYWLERTRDHSGFGSITFLRGTFNQIPRAADSVDLLVSVSAFEHNKYEDMPGSVAEFLRVVRPGGSLLVTTSLAKEKDWYFEPPKGWNLTQASLARWFSIPDSRPIPYDEMMGKIRGSRALESRIDPYYRFNGENGLPFGALKDARYIPVGIRKRKT